MKPARLISRSIVSIAIVLMMLASTPVDQGVMGATVDTFTGGSSSVTLTLTGGSQNTEASFMVPVDGTVTQATFSITGMDAGTFVYPNRLQVSVGSLAGRVYAWAGRSYSPMGFQDRFTDLSTGSVKF